MAIQTIEELKRRTGMGKLLTGSVFADMLDTVQSWSGSVSAGGTSLSIPVGYHDWDGLNQFSPSGGGIALQGDYYKINISDFIEYEKSVVSEYKEDGGEVDDSIFDTAEILTINNVDFYSYDNMQRGAYDDGQGGYAFAPLFIDCGNVIVTIPYGQSAVFTRSISDLADVMYHGSSQTVGDWRPAGSPITATEEELADKRSQNQTSGS
jgi:hypothetical protein